MKLNPYLAIIIAATIGGSSGVFIKLLDLPATTITFFRMAVPVIVLLAYLKYKGITFFSWKLPHHDAGLCAQCHQDVLFSS